jgi:hypothetical protein
VQSKCGSLIKDAMLNRNENSPELCTPATIQKSLLFLVILLPMVSFSVTAQYGYNQGGNNYGGAGYGHQGGAEPETDGMEDRPKVNLGIRLRIPAFKFELPRVSLPKITVSAKIRQPDGPRVIQLPEINLDTSSKAEPPSHKMQGGGGGYDSQYQGPAYGMAQASYGGGQQQHYGGQQEGSFTFSTEEERPAYKQYQPAKTNYGYKVARYTNSYRPQQQQQYYQQQSNSYSAPERSKSSYSIYNRTPGASQSFQYQVNSSKRTEVAY